MVKRIVVDGGSVVNIMPKSTMKDLGVTIEELYKSQTMIWGFNIEGKHGIAMIHLELTIGDLTTSSIFHVINSKTPYKLMLGNPWLHGHRVTTSTLHQCLMYSQEGEKKINGDVKLFTMIESYFGDAKFFEEDTALKEIVPVTISSTGKGIVKNAKEICVLKIVVMVTSTHKNNGKKRIST